MECLDKHLLGVADLHVSWLAQSELSRTQFIPRLKFKSCSPVSPITANLVHIMHVFSLTSPHRIH